MNETSNFFAHLFPRSLDPCGYASSRCITSRV